MDKTLGLLNRYFGYKEFRKNQREIIENILAKRDTLVIMPTGGGKSICYQIPALIFSGVTLVISPLISLMKDQVDTLNSMGISATYINSSLTLKEMGQVYKNISLGIYKIIYVAPERLLNESFLQLAKEMEISQLAVDEAHCISQWGHDFRPSYIGISDFIAQLKTRPVVSAFTATATLQVQKDIEEKLNISPNTFLSGFDRKNLKFSVVQGIDGEKYITSYLKEHRGECGIIYTSTRKTCDSLYNSLQEKKFSVGKYHAGMSEQERNESQENFLNDNIEIMVATNAFGMGIDKSNVRFVIHNNIPKDLESYYQEAGRGGRDGLLSDCILIFNPKDIVTQRFFIENNEFENSSEILDIKYEKLNSMVNYCHTTKCLRSYILEYFGDAPIENCGNCSNCLDQRLEEDITIEAQKIISCIGKTKERFGINIIVNILSGSKNKRILEWELDSQSTYGLLSQYTQKDIRALINLLIGDGYLNITPGEFPVVTLTKKAMSFIRNGEKLYRKVEVIAKKEVEKNDSLFEELRILRRELALAENIPPFVIFSDKTLKEMSSRIPLTEDELLDISGVGEFKLKKYGAQFLKVLNSYQSSNQD